MWFYPSALHEEKTTMKTVIGLFDTASDAQSAQNELIAAGFPRDRISLVTSESNRELHGDAAHSDKTEAAEGAGVGATAGALAGGAAGLLASLGLLAIPGIGGLLALGPIVATLTGAGIGAAAGGLIGGLVGMGIPEHEAEVYAEGVNRGGTLVSVDTQDDEADRVAAILSQHNAVDIDKRASEWERGGWQRRRAPATSSTSFGTGTATTTGSTTAMPTTPSTGSTVDARSRGVERPAGTSPADDVVDADATGTGGMDPGTSDIGSARRSSSARIYNPR
jgi:hypothetical protein